MNRKVYDPAYQFFNAYLRGKGIDQPTIDFVWEHGEGLYLWQEWFGTMTLDSMRKCGELTQSINAQPKDMPPLKTDLFAFDQIHINPCAGRVKYVNTASGASISQDITGSVGRILPGQVIILGMLRGEVPEIISST